jgi:hypothetical protein
LANCGVRGPLDGVILWCAAAEAPEGAGGVVCRGSAYTGRAAQTGGATSPFLPAKTQSRRSRARPCDTCRRGGNKEPGCTSLFAESFVDPERFSGAYERPVGWHEAGATAGHRRAGARGRHRRRQPENPLAQSAAARRCAHAPRPPAAPADGVLPVKLAQPESRDTQRLATCPIRARATPTTASPSFLHK